MPGISAVFARNRLRREVAGDLAEEASRQPFHLSLLCAVPDPGHHLGSITSDLSNIPMTAAALAHVVDFCCRHAWKIVLLFLVIAGAAFSYTTHHFAIDTDTVKLFPPDLPWRQHQAAFDRAFPMKADQIAVVVDALTPELAEQATASLTARLQQDPEAFPRRLPARRRHLLPAQRPAVPADRRRQASDRSAHRGPALARPAGGRSQPARPDGRLCPLSGGRAAWRGQACGFRAADGRHRRHDRRRAARASCIRSPGGRSSPAPSRPCGVAPLHPGEADPRLQLAAAGRPRPRDTIRADVRELGLTPDHGVRVRLTGSIPLADEEFGTLAQGVLRNSILTVVGVALLLWLALRSVRIIVAILLTLVVGLGVTAAFGLLAVGPFNPISFAFAVLFIGLGVDFGIQFAVRYRDERYCRGDLARRCRRRARASAARIALAAGAIAVGFFSFLPTDYTGVTELGLIAGIGMLIAFVLSLTLLPALLRLMRPRGEAGAVGFAAGARSTVSCITAGGWCDLGRGRWRSVRWRCCRSSLRFQPPQPAQPEDRIGLDAVRPDEGSARPALYHRDPGALAGRGAEAEPRGSTSCPRSRRPSRSRASCPRTRTTSSPHPRRRHADRPDPAPARSRRRRRTQQSSPR